MIRPILCFIFLISSFTMEARQLHWLPTIGGWEDGQNWSLTSGGSTCNCTPGTGDTTYLNIVGSIVTIGDGETARANQVQVGFNATLRVGKSFGSSTVLTIADSDVGMVIIGTLQAYGQVNINRTPKKGLHILSGGTCKIEPGAIIDIKPLSGVIDTLVYCEGTLSILADQTTGKGQLLLQEVGRFGLLSSGPLAAVDNHGEIRIDSSLSNVSIGIRNISSSIFTNAGNVSMMRCLGTGFLNEPNASLDNQAEGQMEFSGMHAISIGNSGGIFHNSGTIMIEDGTGIFALSLNSEPFVNTGIFICKNQAGTAIDSRQGFTNLGSIQIENCGTGILQTNDSLLNVGDIFIKEGGVGISISANAMLLRNEGSIVLENIYSNISTYVDFENIGEILMSQIVNKGIILRGTTLRNSGEIVSNQSPSGVSGIFVYDNSTLLNECEGTIKVYPRLMANFPNASVTNHGYLELDVNLLLVGGTFLNHGIISDLNDGLANNGIQPNGSGLILTPLQGQHTLSIPSHKIIEGDLSAFTFDPIVYYDIELSAPAGSFNSTENMWTPGMPSGLGVIYHNIASSCTTFVVRQNLDDDVFSACPAFPNINTKTTTGTWYDHNHWSLNQIPTLCHDVVLPSDMTDISGMQLGQARTIEVQANAFFEVLGILEIDAISVP